MWAEKTGSDPAGGVGTEVEGQAEAGIWVEVGVWVEVRVWIEVKAEVRVWIEVVRAEVGVWIEVRAEMGVWIEVGTNGREAARSPVYWVY